jgi:hypothetical protein
MELFDIVKNIFSKNNSKWDSIGKIDKSRNFFMINRIMSIQYPLQANQFNKLKITPVYVVDWWRNTLASRYSKTPNWIYTLTKKKEAAANKKTKVVDLSATEKFIREKFKISSRDLMQIKKFYPEKYNAWVLDISDQIGLKE